MSFPAGGAMRVAHHPPGQDLVVHVPPDRGFVAYAKALEGHGESTSGLGVPVDGQDHVQLTLHPLPVGTTMTVPVPPPPASDSVQRVRLAAAVWASATQDPDLTFEARIRLAVGAGQLWVSSWGRE